MNEACFLYFKSFRPSTLTLIKSSKIITYIKEANTFSIKAFERVERTSFKFINIEPYTNILRFKYEK